MKASVRTGECRHTPRWTALGASVLLAAALAACGGDDGATGPAGPTGPAGSQGPAGPAGADATAVVNVAALSAEQWAAATFKAEISGVQINGAPVVSFKVTDALGTPVVGLGATSKSATATVASYTNLAFALAKLVPGAKGSPSEWVSYIVTTVPTTTAAATPTRPSTDNTGTLVDNGDGTYKYTFYRDVTKIKDQIAAMPAVTAPADKADLGDLTYDPSLAHRMVIQIGGAARGTGSNTANGATVMPAVNMENPVNAIYNFTPATGKPIAAADLQRDVVAIESCNACHDKLAFHGGGARVDTDYCVVCHTEQRRYGYANVASVAGSFPALKETTSVDPSTGITSFSYSPETRVADGEVAGNFTTMVHKIHQGASLVKGNYNYANVAFNNKGFSMLDNGQRMCSVCHDNTKAVNADNWNAKPSRHACGACHDGINWANGGGSTLADKAAVVYPGDVLKTSGHVGGMQTDDATCYLCHGKEAIKVYHQTVNITQHNPAIEAGLVSFIYDIKSATVNATTNDVTIEFGIKQRTAPSTTDTLVTFVPPAPGVANPLAGFTGGPSFLLAYAQPQDGIAAPADYNNWGIKQAQAISVSIASLLDTANAAYGSLAASVANPGYYIATLKRSTWKFPAGATMRAVGLNGYFTQVTAPASAAAPVARHAISVVKAVTGDQVRRTVVDKAKCSNCHEWFEGHGGNRVVETQVCVMCHVPGMATSGRGIPDATIAAYKFTIADEKILKDWGFNKTATNAALKFPVVTNNFKDMIHGIHAGRERVTPFADARDATSRGVITLLDFRRMDFPGTLNKCETCHVTATTAGTTYNTVPAYTLVSTNESIDAAYAAAIAAGTATPALAKTALNTANATDTVVTQFSAACVSCHDAAAAKAHMTLMGGVVNGTRSAAKPTGVEDVESCAVCHGAGAEFDTARVHR